MLPFPYPAPYGALLGLLFALDVLLLAGGLILGRPDAAQTGRLPRPLRMALSIILVVVALLQWRLAAATPAAAYAGWVLLGMALGFFGDLVMAGLIPTPNRLLGGMSAFGLGHVAYIIALATPTAALGLGRRLPVVGLLLALVAIVLWARLVRKPGGPQALNVAALGYSMLMAATNALALNLALGNARFGPLAAGAALFLISDLILGHWNIRGHGWRSIDDHIWITYNLGQLLIVSSVGAAF